MSAARNEVPMAINVLSVEEAVLPADAGIGVSEKTVEGIDYDALFFGSAPIVLMESVDGEGDAHAVEARP